MLWLLVSVAAFNLVVSLMMIVRDKRGDIAILRTLGASPKTVTKIFLWQGCLIGLIGTVCGLFFGLLGATYVTEFARWLESFFSLQLLSAEVYPIDYLPSEIQALDPRRRCFRGIFSDFLCNDSPCPACCPHSACRGAPARINAISGP